VFEEIAQYFNDKQKGSTKYMTWHFLSLNRFQIHVYIYCLNLSLAQYIYNMVCCRLRIRHVNRQSANGMLCKILTATAAVHKFRISNFGLANVNHWPLIKNFKTHKLSPVRTLETFFAHNAVNHNKTDWTEARHAFGY